MMKDVDIPIRLFASSCDFFYTSSNPHRDTIFTNPLALISSSNLPWFLTFYHSLSYVLFQLINLIRPLFIKLFTRRYYTVIFRLYRYLTKVALLILARRFYYQICFRIITLTLLYFLFLIP